MSYQILTLRFDSEYVRVRSYSQVGSDGGITGFDISDITCNNVCIGVLHRVIIGTRAHFAKAKSINDVDRL